MSLNTGLSRSATVPARRDVDTATLPAGGPGPLRRHRTMGSEALLYVSSKFMPGSIKGSVFTLLVATVGVGTLSLPFAVQQSGLLVGSAAVVAGALLCYFSLHMLMVSCENTGHKTYYDLAMATYGPGLASTTQLLLLLNLVATSMSFLVAAGNMLSIVLDIVLGGRYGADGSQSTALYLTVAMALFLVYPLSLLRDVTSLRFSSVLSILCVVYLAAVTAAQYFSICSGPYEGPTRPAGGACLWEQSAWHGPHNGTANATAAAGTTTVPRRQFAKLWYMGDAKVDWLEGLMNTIPIVVFAYTCHPNVLPIYMSLQRPSTRRMYKVLRRTMYVACALYLVVGVFGYLTFLEQLTTSKGNYLLNDYEHNATVLVGGIGITAVAILFVPMALITARGIVLQMAHTAPCPSCRRGRDRDNVNTLDEGLDPTRVENLRALSDAEYIAPGVSPLKSPRRRSERGGADPLRISESELHTASTPRTPHDSSPDAEPLPFVWHALLTLVLLLSAMVPALLLQNIAQIFSLLGATLNPVISYVLPAMFFCCSTPRGKRRGSKVCAVLVAVGVMAVSALSLVKQIGSW